MNKIRVKQIEDIDTNDTYLDSDLKVTTLVGEVKSFDSGKNYATISATKAGGQKKTVQEVLEEIFSKDNDPTVTQPSASVAVKCNGQNITADTNIEVGTELTIIPTVTPRPGSYQYGPATGVTGTPSASLMKGSTSVETITPDGTTAFAKLTLTEGATVTVKGSVAHTAGATPKTQLGSDAAALAIAAGSKDATSKNIKAYRKYFYGVVTSTGTIGSDMIRALQSGSAPAARNNTFNIAADSASAKRMIVAVPKGVVSGLTALLTTSMNADISSNFVKQASAVDVKGAADYAAAAYDVWVFQPDAFQGNENVKITFK